jgi:hypothetical protein
MSGQQSAVPERGVYEASQALSGKLHSAALVLKGLDRLIMDGLEQALVDQPTMDDQQRQSIARQFELTEIVWQLLEVTSAYVKEAQDVANEITAAVAHQ